MFPISPAQGPVSVSSTPSNPVPANDTSHDSTLDPGDLGEPGDPGDLGEPGDPSEGDADFARRIIVGHSADDAAEKCAAYLAQCIRERAETSATVTVAFSGGSTPARMFEHLAQLAGTGPEGPQAWWRAVEVFQVDERVAPDGDPARNANDLTHQLLEPTHVATSQRHLIPVLSNTAALDYEATVDRLAPSGIDIVVLGLGDDGHTASLVPGDPVVEERGALVAKTGLYKGHTRITLTRPCLDAAGLAIWLVTGAGKAEALEKLVAFDQTIPAGLIRTAHQIVFADSRAANESAADAAGPANAASPVDWAGEHREGT